MTGRVAPIQPVDFFRRSDVPLLTTPGSHDIDWEKFLNRAVAESVLPALIQQTKLLGLQSQLPSEIYELFAAAEALNAERNHKILADATDAIILLNQIGIKPVALKGLAFLLSGIYPDPAARYLLDIDFLLLKSDIPRAITQLKKFGYFENDDLSFPQFHHHHPAVRRAGECLIEVHNRVGFGVCNRLLSASQIFEQAKSLTFKGAELLIPSPTHLANHLILHSQLAHPYHDRIFPPLRSLIDLAQLQRRFAAEIDWSGLVQTYRDNQEYGTLLLYLRHAHEMLQIEIPEIQTDSLPLSLQLRYQRRKLLSNHPGLCSIDPIYTVMSLVSRRRLYLVIQILKNPSCWPQLFRLLISPAFYRNLLS